MLVSDEIRKKARITNLMPALVPEISLWNSVGQEVIRLSTEGFAQSETFGSVRVDVSTLPQGIYLLVIKKEKEVGVYKVMKE